MTEKSALAVRRKRKRNVLLFFKDFYNFIYYFNVVISVEIRIYYETHFIHPYPICMHIILKIVKKVYSFMQKL